MTIHVHCVTTSGKKVTYVGDMNFTKLLGLNKKLNIGEKVQPIYILEKVCITCEHVPYTCTCLIPNQHVNTSTGCETLLLTINIYAT